MTEPAEPRRCDLSFHGRNLAEFVMTVTSDGRWLLPDGTELFLHEAACCDDHAADCCRGRETQKKMARYLGWEELLVTTTERP